MTITAIKEHLTTVVITIALFWQQLKYKPVAASCLPTLVRSWHSWTQINNKRPILHKKKRNQYYHHSTGCKHPCPKEGTPDVVVNPRRGSWIRSVFVCVGMFVGVSVRRTMLPSKYRLHTRVDNTTHTHRCNRLVISKGANKMFEWPSAPVLAPSMVEPLMAWVGTIGMHFIWSDTTWQNN